MNTGRSKHRLLSRLGLGGVLCGLLAFWPAVPNALSQVVGPSLNLSEPSARRTERPTTGVFSAIALRVEFQPDTTRYTTGDGTFATDPYGGLVSAVDPIPHDRAFFEAHLQALSHYVETVSDGLVELNTFVLPAVLQAKGRMQEYAPVGLDASSDQEISKLSALVEEVWTMADGDPNLTLPPGAERDRTFFVLFHAGVGRDIELLGTTLDKTPLDLPSIFFGREALDRLGTTGLEFGGLPVDNVAIIPRTETRRGFNFISDEPFLVELSTNGLLAASFLNFLGVPDLFNTETAESAIGPFGLMDPLGIFAYGGLIPPEPSAWTKLHLGWTTPTEVRSDLPAALTLQAVSTSASDVARVWISDAEYFLVENRSRDAAADGLTMHVWSDGVVTEQRVANGDPTFNSRTIEGFSGGVVVAVDEYDWALPGGVDEDDNPLLGGLLVWHVDERRIAERIASNTINSDPAWRGVDLEEADSGQDLGFPSPGFLGPALDQGSPFDFFYRDNPVRVITASGSEVRLYENRFGHDTYPNSRSNGGGPSFIELRDFSEPGPAMTLVVDRSEAGGIRVDDLASFDAREAVGTSLEVQPGGAIRWCNGADEPFYATLVKDSATGAVGLVFADDEGFIAYADTISLQPHALACSGNETVALGITDDRYRAVTLDPRAGRTASLDTGVSAAEFGEVLPVVVAGGRVHFAFRSSIDGVMVWVDPVSTEVHRFNLDGRPHEIAYAGSGRVAIATDAGIAVFDETGQSMVYDVDPSGVFYGLAFGRDVEGFFGVAATAEYRLIFLDESGVARVVDALAAIGDAAPPQAALAPPSLDDVDGDGRLDVVVSVGRRVLAYTRQGAVVDGFPIEIPSAVIAPVLTAGIEQASTLVVGADDGYIYAYDVSTSGRPYAGFPIAASSGGAPALRGDRIFAVSSRGTFRVWQADGLGEPRWAQDRGGPEGQSYFEIAAEAPTVDAASLIIPTDTYNWPNPVRNGRTNFRVSITRDASLTITIVDMAGGFVDRLHAPLVRAGTPFELTWVTEAGSGLYFGRVTATSPSGSESKLIPFAIVR